MTDHSDGPDPDEPTEGTSPEGSRKLDEDAAWRAIIENYGERPQLGEAPPAPATPEPQERATPPVLEPGWQDQLNTEATWEDEGHFVPPVPPPLPPLEPRRRLAWFGLFGAPALLLLAVVLGWSYPDWILFLLASGFIGGFVYLVATMSNSRPGDGSGDDGAVV